ncbi:hypothetical protein ONE63_010647 [Megalurothrips usitatus]|uniref:C2H2-type domain-containing protein n=1 Tax=Megalurothrips usitatus TaxID=439358 RepID=A0AAV7XDL8_9NEOP|nr:hypothetical protein ONE63_010647 [Megalurothrips usitatus]
MTSLQFKATPPPRFPRSRSHLQQVLGNTLKVEEKLQVLDTLISSAGPSCESKIHGHKRTDHSDYCDQAFSQPSLKESYQNIVRQEHKRFPCRLCDKGFSRKSDLCNHLATHLSLQGYVCEICGRSFSHISNLIRHSHIHSGLKPYPCKICGRRFRQTSALLQHKISHHGAQPVLCPTKSCDKKFRTPVIARRHAYREHPNASLEDILPNSSVQKKQRCFYCKICGDQFRDLKHLKAHKLGHVEEKDTVADENRIVTLLEKVELPAKAYSESHSGVPQIISKETKRSVNNSILGNEVQEDVYNTGLPKVQEKLQNQDDKKNCDSDLSLSAESNDNKSVDESESKRCTFSEKKDSWHSIGSLNAGLMKLVSHINIHSLPDQVFHSGTHGVNSPVDFESDIEGSKLKDGCSAEDLSGSSLNEIKSSNVTFDVDMGLCPDSPSNTLDGHQLTELDCSNEADNSQCCDGKDNYKTISDSRSELTQVKSIILQDNYSNTEPLMLSFGDSYLTLLKEMGIVEEDVNGAVEKLKSLSEQSHDETADPLSPSFWDCYPTVPSRDSAYNNEKGESALSSVAVQENNSESNEMVKNNSQTTSVLIQELPESNRNIDSGLADNYELTTDFTGNITSLIPSSMNKMEEIIVYVGSDTEVRFLPIIDNTAVGSERKVRFSSDPFTENTQICGKKPNRTKRVCPECGKIFFKGSNLTQHLGLHFSNMKQYKCEFCDQSFSWKSSLNKHMTSHAVVLKQFLCDVCGKQYKSLDQVKQHERRDHQSLRPHSCLVCSKSFFRKYDLTIHERIHSNNKPYMCETCGKTFNHLSHMKRHENVHYKDRTVSIPLHPSLINI